MQGLQESLIIAASYLVPGLIIALVLRFAHPTWWRWLLVKLLVFVLPPLGLVFSFGWLFSFEHWTSWAGWLSIGAFGVFLLQLVLAAALLLTAILAWSVQRVAALRSGRGRSDPDRLLAKPESAVDLVRRRFWRVGLAAIPLVAAGTSLAGVAGAAGRVRIYRCPLTIEGLPPSLNGFRILHISDLHLGAIVQVDTVADIMVRVLPLAPHLVALTGDLADDLRLLPDALALIAGFGAPFGTYSVLGNHEYGNGVDTVRKAHLTAGVPLLEDDGRRLPVGDAVLEIAGIDDLHGRRRGETRTQFFQQRIAAAFSGSRDSGRSNDMRLLLSHRPEAFDEAARQNVHLTLAGHTHGGQVGIAGRSLLETLRLYPYPWGHYRRGPHHLYTTSGAGHWVPFRLGCPTEALVIELFAQSS